MPVVAIPATEIHLPRADPFPKRSINSIVMIVGFLSSPSLAGHLNNIQISPLIFIQQYESQWYFGEEIITIKIQQKGGDNDGWNKSYLCQLLLASLSRVIWPSGALECWWDDGMSRLPLSCPFVWQTCKQSLYHGSDKCTYKLDFVFGSSIKTALFV